MYPLNDYDNIYKEYSKTDTKPDKLYSTLPTVLKMIGPVKGKTVLDLGCGRGFFTEALALSGAERVIGIDNSVEQIKLAQHNQLQNVEYLLKDIFEDSLPNTDFVVAPYVINYAQDTEELVNLIEKIHQSLNAGGTLVMVVDLPEGKDLRKFGAIKRILGEKKDGAQIEIELFNDYESVCILNSVYFSPETLEKVLYKTGFRDVTWQTPIVSEEGLTKFGKGFWAGYTESSELGYITAVK